MSDDWQVGDLALCVRSGLIVSWAARHLGDGLKKGRIYAVEGLGLCAISGLAVLYLKEHPKEALASRFRKIRPHAPDAEDEETIRLLNGVPVDA